MREDTVEIIPIDEDNRLVVVYDYDAERPYSPGCVDDPVVLHRWEMGEVFGVIWEVRVVWTSGDRTMETWDEEESLWDCYLDDEYTAQMVAETHWGLK